MSINTVSSSTLKKQLFNPKPANKDGLLLRVHHTTRDNKKEQVLRFIHAAFNPTGSTLAIANVRGDIFLVNLLNNKYWLLQSFTSCTVLKYSVVNEDDLLMGLNGGDINVVNTGTGETKITLKEHTESVVGISFSSMNICLCHSRVDAIIWDMKEYVKLFTLCLYTESAIKEIGFMPATNFIVGYDQDDIISFWDPKNYLVVKQLVPDTWEKFSVKSLAFTKDGRVMVISGTAPQLAVYFFDCWSIVKVIKLPEDCKSVKKVAFVSQPFDAGANRLLAVLGTNGIIYLYNMETDYLVTQVTSDSMIKRMEMSSDGKYLVNILTTGQVHIYSLGILLNNVHSKLSDTSVDSPEKESRNVFLTKKSKAVLSGVQKQLKEVLDLDKLKLILKEFNEYPNAYRKKIWAQLLKLPMNSQQYNSLIGQESVDSLNKLSQQYPLENKTVLKNFKKLITNLYTWCPFFDAVDFLPAFVFPFVKVFNHEPIACFEAVLTILVNWCQFWFEYHPLPPINILAIIENIFLEQDSSLLNHLANYGVHSKLYAWPFLESAFSEVLLSSDWLIFWDHVLSNEPSFLLFATVAYNLTFKITLLSFNKKEQFELFYHQQNPLEVKRFISKTYGILENTLIHNHPNQYLKGFQQIQAGLYPKFDSFPQKFSVEYFEKLQLLKQDTNELVSEVDGNLKAVKMEELEQLREFQKQQIENNRLREMELAFQEQTDRDRKHIATQCEKLSQLRDKLDNEQKELIQITKNSINDKIARSKTRNLDQLIEAKRSEVIEATGKVLRTENDLVNNFWYLSKLKLKIEQLAEEDEGVDSYNTDYDNIVDKHKEELKQQVKLAEEASNSKKYLKELNIATGLKAMDQLISKIEREIENSSNKRKTPTISNTTVFKLTSETKELQSEVDNLMKLIKPA